MSMAEGRVALITGASRGIGQAVAVRLAGEGATVAVIGRGANRSTDLAGSLDETVELVRAASGRPAIVVRADIGDPSDDRAALVADVARQAGAAPDVLVHSAAAPREFGGGKPSIPFAELSREFFARAVDVNVWAFWSLAQAMIPGMRARGAGWLLTISSVQAAPRPSPVTTPPAAMGGACAYGGTKAFLDRIVTGAAQELFVDNIAVNALAPTGPVQTPLSSTVVANPPGGWEPMETMVEAAVALCTGEPRTLTSRVAYSVPLLVELGREVRTIDASARYSGWQPGDANVPAHYAGYLTGH
jgi:NAD(P)-dependent dehydrogenase (short-subunit alcohol dehydrogenase family)